eukprot:scaffold3743_cov389-Prasinococcus_capsulatus_cf.AAC.20
MCSEQRVPGMRSWLRTVALAVTSTSRVELFCKGTAVSIFPFSVSLCTVLTQTITPLSLGTSIEKPTRSSSKSNRKPIDVKNERAFFPT